MTSPQFIFAGLFGLAVLTAPVSVADTVAGTPDASVHYISNKVADSLASLPLLNEVSPNLSARYYIYLCSAGWCGPCNREMPHVTEAYSQMKKTGLVELLLVDYDKSEEQARQFLSKYGVAFPVTMSSYAAPLPGFSAPRGIPFAIIVDAEGNVVKTGHGSIVGDWQKIISAYEKEKSLSPSFPEELTLTLSPHRMLADVEAEDADDDATDAPAKNAVAAALRKVKWFNGKPSRKAEYYIYLQSASWCPPCRAEMPGIAEEYQTMKKDGRVELVLLGGDRSAAAAKGFLKDNKAKFPGTLRKAKGVAELPGVDKLPNYFPAAVIVKADGTVVTSGHGSLVAKWREFTIGNEESADDSEN